MDQMVRLTKENGYEVPHLLEQSAVHHEALIIEPGRSVRCQKGTTIGGAGLLVSEYPPPPSSPMSGNLSGTVDWLHAGKSTYPAYAYNSRGGVVCGGVFSSVTLQQPFFANPIPAIELLFPASPMGQSQPAFQKSQYDVERRLIELMRLDAWLSIVGRSRAIRDGPSALLIQAPAVVRSLMDAFELDFLDADTSSLDGGAQINRAVAASVVDNLERNTLVGAEVLYALVATLRAVKVGECVLTGPDTAMLAEILEKDVQVSLV
ncbi:hypothetical protein BR93DRAFT_961933 [Coniochaeta sp. PMI_546]|nr:hypothetical protein BR93DRAFT_961933 [Coniochaeta sp. PMI_546]